MIEDKELGLKLAESKDEAFWTLARDNTQTLIEESEKQLKFHKAVLEMCEVKLKEVQNEINSSQS